MPTNAETAGIISGILKEASDKFRARMTRDVLRAADFPRRSDARRGLAHEAWHGMGTVRGAKARRRIADDLIKQHRKPTEPERPRYRQAAGRMDGSLLNVGMTSGIPIGAHIGARLAGKKRPDESRRAFAKRKSDAAGKGILAGMVGGIAVGAGAEYGIRNISAALHNRRMRKVYEKAHQAYRAAKEVHDRKKMAFTSSVADDYNPKAKIEPAQVAVGPTGLTVSLPRKKVKKP